MFYDWQYVDKAHVEQTLKHLRGFFENPDMWVYWPIAIDSFGNEVDPTSDFAVKFSLMGAIDKFCIPLYGKELSEYINCATREYLNDLSDDRLTKGLLDYKEEYKLIIFGLQEL